MSDCRLRGIAGLAVALLLLGSAPVRAAAQDPAQLKSRLVAALHNRKLALDTIEQIRARRAIELPPDSLNSGVVHVRFSAANLGGDLQETLAASVREAAALAARQIGDTKLDGPGTSIIVERVVGPDLGALRFYYVRVELPGTSGRIAVIRSPVTQHKLTDQLLDMVGTLASAGLPDTVTKWAGYWTPSHPATDDDWVGAALDLMTSTSSVARACYTGSESSCESALGLTPVHDRLTEWYTPEGWRSLVDTWTPPASDPALVAAHDDCVVRKVFETCERLARTRQVPVPLNMFTRSTLFSLALTRGGPAAYARLRNAKGTPREVLATVAGVPAGQLVDEWRSRTLAAAPRSEAPAGRETVALIAWTALFGFAATRRRA